MSCGLRVPPLSERREDIPEVANDLLQRVADATGLPARPIGEDTLAALQGHDWPGNVRQLRNVIERLLILAPSGGGPIRADALPNDVSEDAPSVLRWEKGGEIMQLPLRDAREVFEREYLLAQVTRFGGNISRTATFVGMERSALHRKLKSLGLHGGAVDDRTGGEAATENSRSVREMARYAYVNGRYVDHREASVHVEDRGYQLADGVYEVVGVRDGKLIDETLHIDRLGRSLKELRIDWPVARPTLGFIIRELMRRNRLRDGLVYMQVTRGVARRDHAFPTKPVKPALVLTTKNSKRAEADPGPGIAVKSHPDIRWQRCDIKTVALLPNVLAKQAARESGAYEAWLIDGKGNVTEGASTNAWIVTKAGELVTRATDNAILAGITRHTLKVLAGDLQLKLVERPFTLAEAKEAKEAFITSATSFVTPVVRIDDDVVGDGKVGPTARRLREEYVRFAADGEAVT